jgi:hypothetical protein
MIFDHRAITIYRILISCAFENVLVAMPRIIGIYVWTILSPGDRHLDNKVLLQEICASEGMPHFNMLIGRYR